MTQNQMQKFIIPGIHAVPATGIIQGQDAKHIFRVLRLTAGDVIHITNGEGKDFRAKIVFLSPMKIQVDIVDELPCVTESPIDITLCSGMLKDNKMDLVIKQVTQLGITRWIPFFCERSIPCPDAKRMANRHQRWETIARESLKQCRRSRLPQIADPLSFANLMTVSKACDVKIAFWEKATQGLAELKKTDQMKQIILLIGPEGGFSETEIQQAKDIGFLSFSLGPRILRAETAAISSCTLIQHLLGDI